MTDARVKLHDVVRDLAQGPTIIHRRGRNVAVLLALADYEQLLAQLPKKPVAGRAFLQRLELVKRKYAGGVEDFEPEPMKFVSENSFAHRRTSSDASDTLRSA